MSEKDAQTPESVEAAFDETVETSEAPDGTSTAAEPAAKEPPARRSGGVAWLALLLALAGLVLGAWPWLNGPPGGADVRTELASLESGIEAQSEEQSAAVQTLRGELERFQSALDDQRDELRALVDAAERRAGREDDPDPALSARLTDIEGRLDGMGLANEELERTLASVREQLGDREDVQRDIDRELALKLDLIEASALLGLGQALAETGQDPLSALLAYGRAQARLRAQDDSRLNQARERLAAEIDRIESADVPDWAGARVRLLRWSRSVDDWPLKAAESSTEADGAAAAADGGWWSSMRDSLGQLVEVERRDASVVERPPIGELQEVLRLHLAAAGLAVERRDGAALRPHLTAVVDLLDRFFAVDREPLSSVRADLDALRGIEASPPPADLGQARAALERVIESL